MRGPQVALVGEELRLSLRASTSATLGFDLEEVYAKRPTRPVLTQLDGEGIFRFTPLGEDVGALEFVFTASQDGVTSRVRWPFEVVPPTAKMVFRQPIGAGTTFDPAAGCVDIPLAVDHASATEVTFTGGEGWPESASLAQSMPLAGSVAFCPSEDELAVTSIFPLAILATDPFGNQIEKRYVLVAEGAR